jgi:hypothetical protein
MTVLWLIVYIDSIQIKFFTERPFRSWSDILNNIQTGSEAHTASNERIAGTVSPGGKAARV